MSDSCKCPHFRISWLSDFAAYLFPVFFPCLDCIVSVGITKVFIVSEFHFNPRGFPGLLLLDLSHIPMHFILLYFVLLKCISCVSRCARELLLPMYIVVLSAKAEVFSSFLPITITLMPLFCFIFSKNLSAKILYRASLPQSSLH